MKTVLLVLLPALAIAGGCVSEKRDVTLDNQEVWQRAWTDLRHDPLAIEQSPHLLSQTHEFTHLSRYGDYIVLSSDRQALLIGRDKRALWAGLRVLPLKVDGQVGALLLVTDIGRVGYEYNVFGVRWIPLGGVSGLQDQENDYSASSGGEWGNPYVFFWFDPETNETPFICDMDNDGTDEFLFFEPELGIHGFSWQNEWQVVLYSMKRPQFSLGRLFEDDPPPKVLHPGKRDVFPRVIVDLPALPLYCEPQPVEGGVRVLVTEGERQREAFRIVKKEDDFVVLGGTKAEGQEK